MPQIIAHKFPGPDGAIHTATVMDIRADDNLVNQATFHVTLKNASAEVVGTCCVPIDAAGYAKWDGYAPDYAGGAAAICAAALGLTLA